MIDIGAHPMRVRYHIVRARRDEQPLRLETAVLERLSRMVSVEREAALEPAANVWVVLEPSAVRREAIAVRQTVSSREPLQRQIGERCCRLADGEPRMYSALQQYHVVPEDREDARHESTREPTAYNGDVVALARHCPPHTEHAIRGSDRPVRLSRASLSIRAELHSLHVARRCASHRSAVTTVGAKWRHRSNASSSPDNVGGVKWPSACSRSISP